MGTSSLLGRRLRVGLDMSPAGAGGELACFTQTLWEHLHQRGDLALRAFASSSAKRFIDGSLLNLPLSDRALHTAWRVLHWPRVETFLGNVEVAHSIAGPPPPTDRPLVLSWLSPPNLEPGLDPSETLRTEAVRHRALQRTSFVLTPSEAAKSALSETTGYDRERIIVAPPGLTRTVRPGDASPIEGTFVLALGELTPRSGFGTLARAISAVGPNAPLMVIVGRDGHRAADVRRELDAALPAGRVVIAEEEQRTRLIADAALVCVPSRASAFGYTCLEAMGAGKPIVASDIPSLRELTSGTAVLVAPDDVDGFAGAISRLLRDPDQREKLAMLARVRASTYSWEATASRYAEAYERAAGG